MSCMDGSSANEDEEKSRQQLIYNNAYLETHPHMDIYNHHHPHMVGFPPQKNDTIIHGPASWKRAGFFDQPSASSYHHDFAGGQILHEEEEEDDGVRTTTTTSCVFPCEGNERPSHGLSLSLNSSNPSAIGLQSFELRQSHDYIRFGPSSFIRGSRYLAPAQELLSEFCDLGSAAHDNKMKGVERNNSWQESEDAVVKRQSSSLYSLDLLDLQRRKTKLLHMLEEVDRRYKHYCDQMRSVVSSFESVAGNGAAATYSSLASRAMSRHFRALKDGISSQIKATRKAMGEKDASAPGSVIGETPRLRLLDQTLRQQRALQQMGNMEIHPWRPQRGLPERSVSVLRAWLFEHFLHPYPSDVDKHILARQTGLSRSQVSNWFINARVRLWKPMVEEMYLEELKEEHQPPPTDAAAFSVDESDDPTPNSDQKPTHDQLLRIESDCFSSIMNNNNNNPATAAAFDGIGDHSFGGTAMEFDFASYGNRSSGGGGVSLTLGLHQHGGGGSGMNMPYSAADGQGSMFSGGMEENCETVQYSMMDGEGGQNLPYRNLMGAQLLRDFAG